jgi:hypothetical protein
MAQRLLAPWVSALAEDGQAPQVPQTLPAPVISLPKTSYSSPPIAFPPDSGVLDAEFVEPARPRVEICVAGHPE